MFDGAALDEVRERAMVILWSSDYVDLQRVTWPGPVVGFENMLAFGWIGEDENIQWSADGSSVTFGVFGPGYWMAQSEAYPGGVKDKDTVNNWKFYQDPTVDAALWNLLHWRSTVDRVIDVVLAETTRTATGLLCYGRCGPAEPDGGEDQRAGGLRPVRALFVQVDPQITPVAERAGIAAVRRSARRTGTSERRSRAAARRRCSLLEASGTSATKGTSRARRARSWGGSADAEQAPDLLAETRRT